MTMYKRLAKEFRQLLLPSCVAAGAACMMPLFAWFAKPSGGDLPAFFSGLNTFAFFGGIAIAAGMAFGAEFQQRTLGLLISQPVRRSRIWNEKMLALLSAVTAISLVLWVSRGLAALILTHSVTPSAGKEILLISQPDALLGAACVLGTVCSVGFWTLFARSTIGGIVFSVASQFFVALGTAFALDKIYGPDFSFETTSAIIVVGSIYSVLFLWLGRRRFAHLELRDVASGEGGFRSERLPGKRWWSDWLRCRPSGMTLNLIRKELLLQKPVFLIAAILTLGWLVTMMLFLLQPARKEGFEITLTLLTVLYVAVIPLLAGCISLGEEKALGLTAWHHTLPISARRQWLLKLAVSITVAVALGFGLPWLLSWMSAMKIKAGLFYLMQDKYQNWPLHLTLCGLPFLMSFWAVTLLANTLRAALASVISVVALCLCSALAVWCALLIGPMETALLLLPTTYFQLPLDFWSTFRVESQGIPFVIEVIIITTLAQGLIQFRRANTSRRIILKYSATLGAVVFLMTFWVADFANSASAVWTSSLQLELGSALSALPFKDRERVQDYTKVTWQELEQTGKLSGPTKAWLKNTSISFLPVHSGHSDSIRQTYSVNMEFPNGMKSQVHCHGPSIRQKVTTPQNNKPHQPTTGEKP